MNAFQPLSRRRGSIDNRVLVAVLLAVIIAALAYTFWTVSAGEESERSSDRRSRQGMAMKCQKCGHEFEMSIRDLANQSAAREKPAQMVNGFPLGDCPSCKAAECAAATPLKLPDPKNLLPRNQVPDAPPQGQ